MKLEIAVIPVSDVDRAKDVLPKPRLEAGCRLRRRRRLPRDPVHPARLRRLGHLRQERDRSGPRLRAGPVPGRLRHRGRPQGVARPRRRGQRTYSTPATRPWAPDEPYLFGRARINGADPEQRSYRSFASFSDPDGNGWLFQEVTARLPGRVDADTTFSLIDRSRSRAPACGRRAWRAREAQRRPA